MSEATTRPGDEIPLVIERLAARGDGVARAPDGRVAFVDAVAPGDHVRARVVGVHKSFLRCVVTALEQAGPDRVDPPCPVAARCGGCSWQHVAADAQVRAKAAILEDAVRRIGRIDPSELPAPVVVHPSKHPLGHRSRARVLVQGGRVGFRRAGGHDVCPITTCPVLLPALDEALGRLAADPPAQDGEWELLAGDEGDLRVQPVAVRGGPAVTLAAAGGRHRMRASPGVFVQAHAELRADLGARVLAACRAGGADGRPAGLAVELYAGAGFFTLGLAEAFEQVIAVEAHRGAARDLRTNLEAAGMRNVRVWRGDVGAWLAREPLPRARLVLVDPPRTGLPKHAPERIVAMRPERIVYVSCDPATLARDLRALCVHEYRIESLEGFDLFPMTSHVEALAVLGRE